jgi:hypothetical protein
MPACGRVRVAREQVAQIRSLTRQANALERELLELVTTQSAAAAGGDRLRRADRSDPDRPHRRRRAVRVRRQLRPSGGHRADPVLLRTARPAPARPRRRPPAQPRATHHRDHSRPPRPGHQGVPRAQRSRGQDQEGSPPLPQTAARAPLPPAPPRRRSARHKHDRHPARSTPTGRSEHRRRRSRIHALHHMRIPLRANNT